MLASRWARSVRSSASLDKRARRAASSCSCACTRGVLSTTAGGAADAIAAGAGGGGGTRGKLDERGGWLGRLPPIGFTLGVPGRGGATGNELSRPAGGEEDDGEDAEDGEGGGGSGARGSADDDCEGGAGRFKGGGAGACERGAGESTSSMRASDSTSDSLFGSSIISCVMRFATTLQ